MSTYTLRFRKPVTLTGDWNYGHPKLRAAQYQAIKARRQTIRRRLKGMLTSEKRMELGEELEKLSDLETLIFGVRHRATAFPIDARGKRSVPRTKRGKTHVPLAALPLNRRGRPHVPSVQEIVDDATFKRFAAKGNIGTALARLAVINPERYGGAIEREAKINSRMRRALNRARSDARPKSLTRAETLILENFYASTVLKRPLCGLTWYDGAIMLSEKTQIEMSPDKYRRILKKFYLA